MVQMPCSVLALTVLLVLPYKTDFLFLLTINT
jgi:hypothetical protein